MSFAVPGAYGDLLTVALAFLALYALRRRWRSALALVWMFTLVGLLDFINAFVQGLQSDIAAQYALGQAYERGRLSAPKDKRPALEWYRKAAEQNYGDAADKVRDLSR